MLKERLIDPVKRIVGEWNRGRIGQCGIVKIRPRTLCDRLHELGTDGVPQYIGRTVSKWTSCWIRKLLKHPCQP